MSEISELEKKILKSFSEKIDPNDAGAHNNLAVVYYNKKLYNEAIELLNRALEIDPNFVLAQNNLDIVLKKSGKWHEYINKLLDQIGDDPLNIDKRMQLADSYRRIGYHAQAVGEYHRILEIDPDYSKAYFGLGLVYKTIGKNEDAITNLKKAVELEPGSPRYLHLLGEVYFHQGNIDKSIEYYRRGLELDPNSPEGHFMLGFALGEKGKYDEAMAELKKAVELNPELAQIQPNLPINIKEHQTFAELLTRSTTVEAEKKEEARLSLADSFLNRGLLDEAKNELDKILKEEPKNFPALLRKAKIEIIHNNLDVASAIIASAEAISPEDVELINLKGVVTTLRSDLKEAERVFRIAVETIRNFGPGYNNLGLLMLAQGDETGAVESLEMACSLGNLQAAWNIGLYLLNKDQPQKALDRLSGQHPKLRYGQALGFIRLDREESAVKILEDVIREIPNFGPAYYQLGFLFSKLGDFPKSIKNMKRGFEIDPGYEQDYYQLALDNNFEYSLPFAIKGEPKVEPFDLGELVEVTPPVEAEEIFTEAENLYRSGRFGEAREKLDALISKAPDFLPGKKLLSEILLSAGEIEAARRIIEYLPMDDLESLLLRARLAKLEDDSESLDKIYLRVLEIDDRNLEALSFLAQRALKLERINEAEEYIRVLQDAAQDEYDTHLLLGLLGVKKKDVDRSILEFERAISIDPGKPLPYYHLGLLYAQKGKFQDSITNWKKCLLLSPPEEIGEKTRRCLEVTLELEDFLKREGEIV